MIIHSLEQAVDNPMPRLCQNDDATSWDETIKESSVVQTEIIMNYIIEQKFALMKEEVKITCRKHNKHRPKHSILIATT